MKIAVDNLCNTFSSLSYHQKYSLIKQWLDTWQASNAYYAKVFSFVSTKGYVSQGLLLKIYRHILLIADRNKHQQYEKQVSAMIKNNKKIKSKIKASENKDIDSNDADQLLENL